MLIGQGEGAVARPDGLLDPRLVFRGLSGRTRDEVIRELAAQIAAAGRVRDPEQLTGKLLEREKLGCTGLGAGIAIPHCKWKGMDDVVTSIATTQEPVDFGAADGAPVDLVVLVVSPADAAAAHLQALARVSRILRTPGVATGLRTADSREKMLEVLREAEAGLPVPQ